MSAPHSDDLEVALDHYNTRFRHRYRLPPTTIEALQDVPGLDERLDDLATARADGVADASCALIARLVLSITPRYAIGFVDGSGKVHLDSPLEGEARSYWSSYVVLVNPLGGRDTWDKVARWVHQTGGEQARRRELAGLASERRPDLPAVDAMLREAGLTHDRMVALPPDLGFSGDLAAEVSFIYDVPPATLRAWKRRYLASVSASRAGRPRKNR